MMKLSTIFENKPSIGYIPKRGIQTGRPSKLAESLRLTSSTAQQMRVSPQIFKKLRSTIQQKKKLERFALHVGQNTGP